MKTLAITLLATTITLCAADSYNDTVKEILLCQTGHPLTDYLIHAGTNVVISSANIGNTLTLTSNLTTNKTMWDNRTNSVSYDSVKFAGVAYGGVFGKVSGELSTNWVTVSKTYPVADSYIKGNYTLAVYHAIMSNQEGYVTSNTVMTFVYKGKEFKHVVEQQPVKTLYRSIDENMVGTEN